MLIKISSKLNSGNNTIASESIYLNRRAILRNLGFLGIASNFINSSLLAKENPSLGYGGGKLGLMGDLAKSVKKNDSEVISVIPSYLNKPNITFTTTAHFV